MKILITGGAGFIGSALVRHLIRTSQHDILSLDKLTYAGGLESLTEIADSPRYRFVRCDICDGLALGRLLGEFQPDVIVHLAAETHVDRSIDGPGQFVQTNIVGTFTLLQRAFAYWQGLSGERRQAFRFHHVSTDEVFGSLGDHGAFSEETAYDPRSPYSATKAGSDHLVRAWGHTYGLPVLISNCSNNYGPFQFPEKLMPLMIIRALAGEHLPVYGDGANIRDWLFVEDHARALCTVFEHGQPGQTYNIGGNAERSNIEVVRSICAELDRCRSLEGGRRHADLIRFVEDRPGHDRRYAIDATKIRSELGWSPRMSFDQGIALTVQWYLHNPSWWEPILARHRATERLGTTA